MAADPLSIASAVVSLAGFAGQTLNGVRYLCDFFTGVRDAPDDIKNIAQELQLIGKILEECLADSQVAKLSNPALEPAVQSCRYWVNKLENRVQAFQPRYAAGGVRRTWAQIHVAFRNKNISKYVKGLQDAKGTPLQARFHVISTSTQRLNSTVDDIQSGLSKISTDQAATRSVLEETRGFSRDLTGQVNSTLVPAIQNLSAQCHSISSTQATQATILSATRDSAFSIENDAAQIKAAVSQLVNGGSKDMRLLAALLQPALEKVIAGRIDAALLTRSSEETLETKPNHVQENIPPAVSTNNTNLSDLQALRHKTATYGTFRSSSVVRFWFGTLFISSTDETTCEMNFASEKLRKAQYFETQVTFVPSRWLLQTGVVLSVKRLISGIAKPQILVALRPITILARDNPVFGAIRRGNLRKVQELVASGSVRPTDICVTGRTLFHITLKVLSRIFSKLPTTGESFSSKKEQSLQTLEVCYWLLANGCSPSPPTPFRDNCSRIISKDLYRGLRRHKPQWWDYTPELSSLAVAMASQAETSPFFRLHGGTWIETDLFRDIMNHDSWRYFSSAVAASAAADVGALGCLRLLQNLWSGYPYKAKSFRDPFEFTLSWDQDSSSEGEEYSVRLVRAAKEEKVWLCGDGSKLSEALKMLYESIRGVLVYASPFRFLSRSQCYWYYYPGRLRKALPAHTGATITSMLSFDTRVASLVHDGETLTQYASKWRVLDVWACALFNVGENPDYHLRDIPRLSLLPLYNPLAFTTRPLGASLYLSRDPLNETCLIFHGSRPSILKYRKGGDKYPDDYPDDEEIVELATDWPVKFSVSHCGIKTSSNIEIVDTSPESQAADMKLQWWNHTESEHCEVRPTDDGGLELFIDCSDEWSEYPWHRLCEEVIEDRKRREEKETEAESKEPAAKSDGPTLLSKVASIGLAALSSIH